MPTRAVDVLIHPRRGITNQPKGDTPCPPPPNPPLLSPLAPCPFSLRLHPHRAPHRPRHPRPPPLPPPPHPLRRPSKKAAVWDSARYDPDNGGLNRSPWGYPTTANPAEPNTHARHLTYANVAFFDGHAAPATPHYFPSFPNPPGGPDPQTARRFHLGYLDSDNDPTTNEHYQLQ